MSLPRRSTRWPSPPSPPQRQLPTGWRALVIGIAFGFSAGFFFTIGIIALMNANSTTQTQSPVGNSAASASATPVPTSAFTPTLSPTLAPTPSPITPTLTPTPLPIPTLTPTPGNSGTGLFAPYEVTFYVVVTIIFLILSAFVLLRPGGKK